MRLRRQAAIRLATDLIGRGLSFGLAYVAQRLLGPADYGELTVALATGFVLTTLTDLGLQIIVTREIAAQGQHATSAQIANAGLTLKLIFSLPAALGLIVISLGRPPAVQFGTLVVGLSLLLNSFVEYFGYALRGWQRADLEALWLLAMRVLTALCGGVALFAGTGWAGLTLAYGGSALFMVLASYYWLSRQRDRYFVPRPRFDRAVQGQLLRAALPLGGAIVLSIAYTRTGVFLLDAYASAASVGAYGVAQKLTEPLAIIPASLLAAVFPALSAQLARHGYAPTRRLRVRTVSVLAVAGGLLALIGAWGAPRLIGWLYNGAYDAAAAPAQWMFIALWPSFINYALTHFLIAAGRQRWNLLFNAGVFALNLALGLWLVPQQGAAGAALAALGSEVCLLIACALALRLERQPKD